MQVATSMMNSVRWLDDASHTVRLACGWIDDGKMNGNIDAPTLSTMPAIDRLDVSMATPSRRRTSAISVSSAPTMPAAGASWVHGCAA